MLLLFVVWWLALRTGGGGGSDSGGDYACEESAAFFAFTACSNNMHGFAPLFPPLKKQCCSTARVEGLCARQGPGALPARQAGARGGPRAAGRPGCARNTRCRAARCCKRPLHLRHPQHAPSALDPRDKGACRPASNGSLLTLPSPPHTHTHTHVLSVIDNRPHRRRRRGRRRRAARAAPPARAVRPALHEAQARPHEARQVAAHARPGGACCQTRRPPGSQTTTGLLAAWLPGWLAGWCFWTISPP